MPDNDQCRGVEARSGDHSGAAGGRGVRIGRTAVTGWALASVLVVAGFGTAMGATPVSVTQPVAVADTTDTSGPSAGAVGLDPLALLPTERPLSPSAVLPDLPTIAPAPAPAATAAETAAPPAGSGGIIASVPGAQMRQAEFTTDAPDARAATAVRTALAQIGLPYVWGGNGPANGDAGFDCSGLTTFSYASAGVSLPRTAHTQYNTGPHVPDGAPLQPGDLVFYGTTARVHHVGMYLGAGRMVNAPTFGKPVQVAFYRYRNDDYLGATRPAASPGSLTSGILPFVDPATLPAVPRSAAEQVFTAPTAPMVALPQPGDPNLPPEQVSAAQSVQEADAVSMATAAARSAAVAGTTTSASAPITTGPAPAGTASMGTVTTGIVNTGVGASPTTAVAGTTTSTTAPVTSTTTTVTNPTTVPQVLTGPSTATSALTSTTTPAPVTAKAVPSSTKMAAAVPKTTAPSTVAPTTVAPTTVAPTTVAPTTVAPTTVAPKTVAPKTVAPKTVAPKTAVAPVTTVPKITKTTTADATTSTAKAVKTTAEDATTTEKSTEKTSQKSSEKATKSDSSKSSDTSSSKSGSSSSSSDS